MARTGGSAHLEYNNNRCIHMEITSSCVMPVRWLTAPFLLLCIPRTHSRPDQAVWSCPEHDKLKGLSGMRRQLPVSGSSVDKGQPKQAIIAISNQDRSKDPWPSRMANRMRERATALDE